MDWKEVLPPWALAALALVGLIVLIALVVALIRKKYRVKKIEVAPLPGVKVELGPEEKPAAPRAATPGAPPTPPTIAVAGERVQVSLGPDGRNIEAEQYVEQVIVQSLPPETLPVPHGFVPPPRAEIYIPRGAIEQQVRERLAGRGVAAIVGLHAPGGVGKTELARRAAADLRDRFETIIWVDVGRKSPAQAIAALALQCGVRPDPTWSYERQVIEVKRVLQEHRALVVLDDVRTESAAALADLVPPSPPCACLVTSRLRQFAAIPATATFELDRMTEEQARALLGAALPPARVQAEPEAVAQLMERCRYNPLALDIAARRILQLAVPDPIAAYTRAIQARLSDLRAGDDPRLNLFAVFDESYDGLSQDDRRRFRALAAFAPTGFSPQAAAAVWGEAEDAACAALERLFNGSLLRPVPGPCERYRLHDLLDEYAAEKLRGSGEEAAARRAQAEWVVALFEAHYADDPFTAPQVTPEFDNLLAAADWAMRQGDGDLLARLATAPRNWLYNVFRAWDAWQAWLARALELGISSAQLKANVLQAMGDVQQFRDEREAALASYGEALRLYRAVGARLGEANVLQAMGDVQQFRDEREAALASYGEALRLYRAVGARLGEANVLQAMGDVQQFRKEMEAALASYGEALRLYRAVGARLGEANVLQAMGDVQQFRAEREAALASYGEALRLYRAVGARLGEANVLQAMGDVQQFRKEMEAALASYGEALRLYRAVGARLGEANVLQAMGDVQQFRKEMEAALASYGEALRLYRAVGARLGEANVLQAMGDVQQFRDEREAALASYGEALRLYRAVGARLGEANVLASQGRLYVLEQPERAQELLDQAIAIYRAIGDRYSVPAQIGNFGWALLRLGEIERARPYLLQAADMFEEIGLLDYAERHRRAARL